MPPHETMGTNILVYLVLSLAIALVVLLTVWRARSVEGKLLLLGLIVSVAAVGYGSLLSNGPVTSAVLMRIGLILVLGGLAVGVMSCCRGTPVESRPGNGPAAEGPRHEP